MSLEERLLSFSLARDADDDDLRAAEPDAGAAAASLEEALPPSGIYRGGEDSAIAYERRADAIDELADRRACDPLADRPRDRQVGAKAVIADSQWSARQELVRAARAAAEARDALRRHSTGVHAARAADGGDAASISVAATWARSGPSFASAAESGRLQTQSEKEDSAARSETRASAAPTDAARAAADADGDADDATFLRAYHSRRLSALRADAAAAAAAASSHPPPASRAAPADAPRPEFGEVLELTDADDFLAQVDGIDARAYAVLLLWEPFLPAAAHLRTRVWPRLAAAQPHIAFLAARSATLSAGIDVIGLPAAIIYRGGATLASLVRLHDLVGCAQPDEDDLAQLLRAHGVQPLAQPRARERGQAR